MQKEIFNDKNQKRRRRVPMLVNIVKSVKYLLVLAVLLIVPIKAWAGHTAYHIPDTEESSFALVNFWDLRDRITTIQITNVCTFPVRIHVQVFNVPDDCDEFDFDDNLTANDTHVYDLLALTANDTHALFPPAFTGGYGIFGVVVIDGAGFLHDDFCLVGSMRMVDAEGYEYRSNSAVFDNGEPFTDDYLFNFNSVDGTVFSDLVGMALDDIGEFNVSDAGIDDLFDVDTWVEFEPTLFDDQENPNSCSKFAFACTPSDGILAELIRDETGDASLVGFDLGINDRIVNSREEPSICNGSNPVGFVHLNQDDSGSNVDEQNVDWFVGFLGLNNGDSTGSFDVFWADDFFDD